MTNQATLCYDPKKDIRAYKSESTLTKKVKDWLTSQKDVFFWKASDRYTKGISDIIACVGGVFVAIELKAEDGEASPHQDIFIMKVQKAGGIGGVCWTLADVKKLVQKAREVRGE